MINTKEIRTEELGGKPMFIADNFLKNPDEVYEIIFSSLGNWHKPNEQYSLNGLYFLDRRKIITGEFTEQVHNLVKELTGEIPIVNHLATNETLFFDEPFNDPENYWWRMHIDGGYNLIIYMSKGGDSCGTNFYDRDDFLNYDKFYAFEHEQPWIPKKDFKRTKHIEGKYNRMVLFNGLIPHGMNLTPNKFINKYRRNIAGFYYDGNTDDSNTTNSKN